MLAMAINDDIACNTQLLSKVHISNPVSLIFAYFNNYYEKKALIHTHIHNTPLNRLHYVYVCMWSSFVAIFINYILPVPISISIVRRCVGWSGKKSREIKKNCVEMRVNGEKKRIQTSKPE